MARVPRRVCPPMAAASFADEGFYWKRSFACSRLRVHWGQPTQNGSPGNQDSFTEIAADPDQDGGVGDGHLHPVLWSSDHRPGRGADTPGLAAKRSGASGDAYAINDQCVRHHLHGDAWCLLDNEAQQSSRVEAGAGWLPLTAIDKRVLISPPDIRS